METLASLYDAPTKRIPALQVQGKSQKTVDWYMETLYSFGLFLSQDGHKVPLGCNQKRQARIETLLKNIPFSELNLENIRSWVIRQRQTTAHHNHPCEQLRNAKKPLSTNTINSRIRCLGDLSDWLCKRGYSSRPHWKA